ncbi:MAG: ACT domain-containing protein [Anaerolineae bacterium]|nr:ACT domain-containing protein [Anaerolineae bacterium]
MTGETQLSQLLKTLTPVLDPTEYVFVSTPSPKLPLLLTAIGMFRETEGITLILPRREADKAGLAYAASFERITLMVHSSLEAVGLTAAVATALAQHGIACNAVAAYYHDHLFVPIGRGPTALIILQSLTVAPHP